MTHVVEKSLGDIPYWEMPIGNVQHDTPIAVVLHWMGGTPESMRFLFDGVERPLRVIFLQAPYPLPEEYGGGYAWFADPLYYERAAPEQAPAQAQAGDRLAIFIRDLKQRYPAKVAVVAMSQGSDVTLSLIARHPELIDLAIVIACPRWRSLRDVQSGRSKLPRVVMFQGGKDHVVTLDEARQAALWLQAAGYRTELYEYPELGHQLEGMESNIRALLEGF